MAAGSDEARGVNAGWLVVAVMVVGPRGMVIVEKLLAAVIDTGSSSRWCFMKTGDTLPVLHVASWLVLAGWRHGVLQELSHQG